MVLQEKLAFQKQEENKIHLFKEGKFWKAYESSACLFVNHIKAYRAIKKMVKSAGMPIVSIGFPEEATEGLLAGCEVERISDNRLLVSSERFDFSQVDFEAWKRQLPFHLQETEPVGVEKPLPAPDPVTERVLNKLKGFRVESSSPIECMLFLTSLQKELHGTI